MRSRWSAEAALTWLAVVAMEAGWITLLYIGVQWLGGRFSLELGIAYFAIAVAVGMILAQAFAYLSQIRYAAVLTVAAIAAGLIAAVLAGADWHDFGALIRFAVINPGSLMMGLAVVRGAFRAEVSDTLATERVFTYGIAGLVAFWLTAWLSGLSDDPQFGPAAFAASLSFVAAGLLALGLGRLADLEVEAIDRGARRRWIFLLIAVVGSILVVGVPLAAVLGLPVTSVLAGVMGPLAPVLYVIFYILAIPTFALLDFLAGLIRGSSPAPQPSIVQPSAGAGGGSFVPPVGAPPDLTWLIIAIVIVAALILLRLLAEFLGRPGRRRGTDDVDEVRSSEPFTLPDLPSLPHLRLRRARRLTPRTASEAYIASLAALAASDSGRGPAETPREHAARVAAAPFGRQIAWLAADYQLGRFGERPLPEREDRRAVNRWRRVASLARQIRPNRPAPS